MAAASGGPLEEGRSPPPSFVGEDAPSLEEPLLAPSRSWGLKGSKAYSLPLGRRLNIPRPELPQLLRSTFLSGGSASSSSSSTSALWGEGKSRAGCAINKLVDLTGEGKSRLGYAMHRVWESRPPVGSWLAARRAAKRRRTRGSNNVNRLDSRWVRDAFHERRAQVLTGDRHNLYILGPYAQLRLRVTEARHLLALDPNGLSDPYVEVFVNDVQKGRSQHVHRTLDPKWDMEISLDIWSPLTIVRIQVMDWDRFSKDDFVGFVEFRVAEVEPNSPWISGWCELRLASMMEGTALHRFRHHRDLRDDRAASARSGSSTPNNSSLEFPMSPDAVLRQVSITGNMGFHWRPDSRSLLDSPRRRNFRPRRTKAPLTTAGKRMKAAMCCRGHQPDLAEGAEGELDEDFGGKRANAGEVHVSMMLETVAKQPAESEEEEEPRTQPALGWILLYSLLRPAWLLDACQDEEWYAFCFPHPEFERTEAQDEKESFSLQDIKEFYDDASDLKAALLNCVCRPLVGIFFFLVCWRDRLLSWGTLAYWLLFCMWPLHLLPTLPLWVAFWLFLLRDRDRANALTAHEWTAPLTAEGLSMMAALCSSTRMKVWLRRLVKDRGGWVKKVASLNDYARLTHKGGKPTLSFDHLVNDLMERPWVCRKVSKEKHCKEGHVLLLLGMGAYQPDDGWFCSGPAALVGQEEVLCQAGIYNHGPHLGVKRYRCPKCRLDFCGLCAAGGRVPAMVMKVDFAKIPMGGSVMVRAMRDFVLENEDLVDDLKDFLEGFLRVVERLRSPKEPDLAFQVYVGLGVSSAVLLTIRILMLSKIGFFLAWAWTLFWMALGSACMVQGAEPIRRLRTAYRASRDFAKCRELRRRGGCARWQFFTIDKEGFGPEPKD